MFERLKAELARATLSFSSTGSYDDWQPFMLQTETYKPLLHAFNRGWERLSPRQKRQLNFIIEFSLDIRHISGMGNVVADFLSKVETIRLPTSINLQLLNEEQTKCPELQNLMQSG